MICYLVRHGKDDETVRGGWSDQPLSVEGIFQAKILAKKFSELSVDAIYSSNLPRAMQTAELIAEGLGMSVIPLPQFREVNNGDLAGMDNMLALQKYPGLFWNAMQWQQRYPNGESPEIFYERIVSAWEGFSCEISCQNRNVILVTHGGVIHILRAILENRQYSNRERQQPVAYTEIIPIAYENGIWKEIEIT